MTPLFSTAENAALRMKMMEEQELLEWKLREKGINFVHIYCTLVLNHVDSHKTKFCILFLCSHTSFKPKPSPFSYDGAR